MASMCRSNEPSHMVQMEEDEVSGMKRDCKTGIAGLVISAFFLFMTLTGIRKVPNLVEPGPLLMPFIALGIIASCSLVLLVNGLRDKTPEKPYFPPGGIKKITFAYLMLVAYGVALHFIGFLIATPFAMMAFIRTLKGENKVRPVVMVAMSLGVTAFLYLMFVKGFSIKLPSGMLF